MSAASNDWKSARQWFVRTLAGNRPVRRTASSVAALGRMARFLRAENHALRELARASASSQSIVVGPWLSEVGFEVLYWVPFLRWCTRHFGIDPSRISVVSRGGAGLWYEGCAGRYVEIFDLVSPSDFKSQNELRVKQTRLQKQMTITDWERQLLGQARLATSREDVFWLHPSYMYRLFSDVFSGQQSIATVDTYTSHWPRRRPTSPDGIGSGEYVAVKFYFNDSFPDTAANRAFIDSLVSRLARRHEVVLLNTGLTLDDHAESSISARVLDVSKRIHPRDNLEFQTRIVANAKAFYGTYGGFSYLAPYYGVPSVAFYSAEEHFLPAHMSVAHMAVRRINQALSRDASFPGYLPSFVSMQVSAFESLETTLNPAAAT